MSPRRAAGRVATRAAFVLVAALAASTLVACGSRRADGALAARPTGTGSREVSREMIAKWNVLDAFDVVQRSGGYNVQTNDRSNVSIRQRRGQTSLTNSNADRPVLVVDGSIQNDFAMLRQIRAVEIDRVQFLSPQDASQRFGTTSSGAGAIIVMTRGRP
ncbi:MAG: hypothetical protein V4617_12515 [Gemmatimonadota bacterium]